MDIDLKDFIEGNNNLFTLCNYKEAKSVLNKFLEWHKARKKALTLTDVVSSSCDKKTNKLGMCYTCGNTDCHNSFCDG